MGAFFIRYCTTDFFEHRPTLPARQEKGPKRVLFLAAGNGQDSNAGGKNFRRKFFQGGGRIHPGKIKTAF